MKWDLLWRYSFRIAIGIVAGGAVGALVYAYMPKPLFVDVVPVEFSRLLVSLDAEGKTRVRERHLVLAPIAGLLARIELHPGDSVEEGVEIARIQPMVSPLLDSQARATAEARLRAAEDARRQGEGNVERAQAALDLARTEFQRTRTLVEQNVASRQQLERADYELRNADVGLRTARFAAQVAAHEVESARAALGLIQAGRGGGVFLIRSPIKGSVLRVERESEGAVASGTPLMELGDLNEIEVVADVLTRDVRALREGMPTVVSDWGSAKVLQGRVRRIEPAAFTRISPLGVEEQRVNVLVDLKIPDATQFGDGFAVDVQFVIADEPRVLQVAANALFRKGEGWGAYVVKEGRVSLRDVQVGRRNPLQTEILSGLQANERVISHPGELVHDGVRVRVR